MLFLAACSWGINMPVMKALADEQSLLVPAVGSMTGSAAGMAVRFAAAATFVTLLSRISLRRILPVEWVNGIGLGVITSAGMWLQTDGLNYTSASTAGFLIAMYCILLPLFAWVSGRRKMTLHLAVCCLLVITGIAALTGISVHSFSLGRGEVECLGAAILFTVQILWVDRFVPGTYEPTRLTWVLCVSVAVLCAIPVALLPGGLSVMIATHASTRAVLLSVYLAVIGTAIPFLIMNRFQSKVNPTSAGFIYCAEPVSTAVFALFLPELLVRAGALYANESFSLRLAVGGALILAANFILLRNPEMKAAENTENKRGLQK